MPKTYSNSDKHVNVCTLGESFKDIMFKYRSSLKKTKLNDSTFVQFVLLMRSFMFFPGHWTRSFIIRCSKKDTKKARTSTPCGFEVFEIDPSVRLCQTGTWKVCLPCRLLNAPA